MIMEILFLLDMIMDPTLKISEDRAVALLCFFLHA